MDATVTVAAVREVGRDTVAVELETPPGFEARPGQFVRLGATIDGESYARFYTLSSPDVEGTFELTVGVDPNESGPFSRFLAELSAGDELDVSGPFGDAAYDGEPRAVVLAGGPGVGAAVGIAERAVATGHEAAVVYRDEPDRVTHRERLDALREQGATVHVTDGELEPLVADVLAGTDGEQVFVYGFQPFVDEAIAALSTAGTDPDAAKVESFG
jgi:cytochrome-b5 reductase